MATKTPYKNMKILTTSNLHGLHHKYKELIGIVKLTKPDIVIINGDILPIDQSSMFTQNHFFFDLKEYLDELSQISNILIQMGDTDLAIYEDDLDLLCNDKIINIHKQNYNFDGYTFLGVPYIADNPHPIKDWVLTDIPLLDYPQQNSQPIISFEDGWIQIKDLKEYLRSQPTIEEEIKYKLSTITDITKTIWVYHNPPHGMQLDAFNNYSCGSSTCVNLIEGYYTNGKQPLLVCCGHAHESILLNHKWYYTHNDCTIVQPSQIREILCYSIIDIKDNKIVYKYHPLERGNQLHYAN